MARNKLIAKYSALNTADLPQRIFDKIKNHIENFGIETLPDLDLSGRWTGKLEISNGGWRGDFDLIYPILAMCRVDRHGDVYPDMDKINACVDEWVDYLTTPADYDDCLGASDETFRDSDYIEDDANEFRSAAYAAEINSFVNSDDCDMLEHDRALSEVDALCLGEKDEINGDRVFESGFNVLKITNAEDLRKIMEAMHREAVEGGGVEYVSPDFDMEEAEKMFAEQEESGPSWMEFIDDLRNGRYGDLPEDYDGLAEPDDSEIE